MKDRYGRPVDSIRISVTKRCNLSCFYCHGEGQGKSHAGEMTPAEIGRIGRVASSIGIRRAKLTGGEPLLRNDIFGIIRSLKESMREVSLTTNGILLAPFARRLKSAGLDRVNVSLDTADRKIYERITGVDALESVLSGIKAAVRVGIAPVKLNTVLMKGLNDSEIEDMITLSGKLGAVLQIIEMEAKRRDTKASFYRKYHVDLRNIESELAARAERVEMRTMQHRMKYFVPGEVEIVRPMHNTEFCAHCHRIRLTSDGMLKPCLFESRSLVDIVTPLRRGATDSELKLLFKKAIAARKPYWT